VSPMIDVDTREFRGDRDLLTRFLRERFRGPVLVQRNAIRVGDASRPETDLSLQDAKDLVKRALHQMGMDDYRVVVQARVITIRERKAREHHARRKGTVPSVRQSVPYFFPG